MWQINGEKTQTANERSLAIEFGTGIHLGSERQVLSDIFPEQLPDSEKTETFSYEYYNPREPCYFSFLVCHCDKNDYDAEKERLKKIPMPEAYLIYGAMEFPYPLPAVNCNL